METTISKVQTPDGVVHDFSTSHTLVIPNDALDKPDATWVVQNMIGSVTLIEGDDYLLNVPDPVPAT